jgi:hypothetical protein
MRYLADLLHSTFGSALGHLSDRQALLIGLDVLLIAETEGIRVPDAAVELRHRIGGPDALQSYAQCLDAGYKRSELAH